MCTSSFSNKCNLPQTVYTITKGGGTITNHDKNIRFKISVYKNRVLSLHVINISKFAYWTNKAILYDLLTYEVSTFSSFYELIVSLSHYSSVKICSSWRFCCILILFSLFLVTFSCHLLSPNFSLYINSICIFWFNSDT